MLELVRTRAARADLAYQMIAGGRYAEAREALQKLAAEEPQNRRLRQRLHLAWGLEHRAAQRWDDALRELERAASFDPGSPDVAEALRVTREGRDAARGLISKLFGR
jgi:tetratricopeptide (TPR) repeat protein